MLCASNPDIITFLEWVKDYFGISATSVVYPWHEKPKFSVN